MDHPVFSDGRKRLQGPGSSTGIHYRQGWSHLYGFIQGRVGSHMRTDRDAEWRLRAGKNGRLAESAGPRHRIPDRQGLHREGKDPRRPPDLSGKQYHAEGGDQSLPQIGLPESRRPSIPLRTVQYPNGTLSALGCRHDTPQAVDAAQKFSAQTLCNPIIPLYFALQSAFMTSNGNNPSPTEQSLETLQDIKRMMERSSRFISLSGLSGVSAGICALIGAYIAHDWIGTYLYTAS